MTFPMMGPSFYHPTPLQPTGLSVNPTVGNEDNSLTLTWTDSQPFFKYHEIERAPDSGGSPGSWATIKSAHGGGSPYDDGGRLDNTKYWYRLTPYNWHLTGPRSNQTFGTTEYSPVTTAPSWASGYPKDDPADAVSILIRCALAVPEALTHKVYWKKNAALSGDPPTNADGSFNWTPNPANPTSEIDHAGGGWVHDDVIYYAVTGNNPDSEGPALYGNATVLMAAPDAPSFVAASMVAGDISVTWQDNSDNEDNFSLDYKERICDGSFGSWTYHFEPDAEAEQFTFTGNQEGYEYIFRVRAENVGGESAYDEMTEGEAVESYSAPGIPTSLVAVKDPVDPTDDIDITWTDPTTGMFDNIALYRHPNTFTPPGTGTLLSDTIEPAVESYDDDGLGPGGGSPTIDSVDPIANDTLQIDISAYPDATEYALYRGLTSGFTPGPSYLVEEGLAFIDFPYDDDDGGGGLDGNTEYFYKLIATVGGKTFFYRAISLNDCGQSSSPSNEDSATLDNSDTSPSSAVSGTTWPDSPLNFLSVHDLDGCDEVPDEYWVDLTWDNGGNTGSTLWIRWSDVSVSGPWTNLNTALTAGQEYYDHLTATHETRNYYEIKFNSGGDGSYSADSTNVICPG